VADETPKIPDALLLIATGCPHCPTVLAGLGELVKQGLVGRLEVVNIATRPEVAQAHGVRSVPWLRLGPFQLEGLRSPAELRQWAMRAGTRAGTADYFNELLTDGELQKVIELVRQDESLLQALPVLLTRADTELPVRVGVSAIFEEFQGSQALKGLVPALVELASHNDAHIRGDAAHLLSLTRSPDAVAPLERLRADKDASVREIASEGVEEIAKSGG
jgi:hypothetical protein